ncbi:hypothetical protein Pint_31770 [Pistacia integerrima]|uniref:Uncharacterized protein n=1 Tax=Pistacia integerrima TaxID=434235 RepID=A0ACC0XN41_9ROSI|nr:hypothetical protein Pint_31770 [Pistacia integerrima]
MCEKECGHDDDDKKQLLRWLLIGVVAFIVAFLFIIFLFWLITKPTKPTFVLQDATLYAFNLSSVSAPSILTSNLQVTISSRNPNQRIGIYYEKVDVYASYRNQQITLPTMIPVTYQGHKDISVWSPFLYGDAVPLSPYVATSLSQDLNTGMVLVNIKVDGKIKWRVGTWISGKYRLNANCPAYLSFGEKSKGIAFATGAAIKYQFVQGCTVEV